MNESINEFENQYNLTYVNRIKHFLPILKDRMCKIWDCKHFSSLDELNISYIKCSIVGVIFVSSANKPTIFADLKGKSQVHSTYLDGKNKYFIEDASGRVQIELKKDKKLATGMVVGLLGKKNSEGLFVVEDICFPGNIIKDHTKLKGKIFIASGLGINASNFNLEKIRLLTHATKSDKIILLGPLFDDKFDENANIEENFKKIGNNVIILPGLGDPTSNIFPLKPLHKRIFGNHDFKHNPCITNINDSTLILTSGEDINDLRKYFDADFDEIDAMKTILEGGYLCPTSPDSLRSEPFSDSDPFFIDRHVDYFIVGNSNIARAVDYNGTVLITVPKFSLRNEVLQYDAETNLIEIFKFE